MLLRTKLISVVFLLAEEKGSQGPGFPLYLLRAFVGRGGDQEQPCEEAWQSKCQDLELLPRGPKAVGRGKWSIESSGHYWKFGQNQSHESLEISLRPRCGITLQGSGMRCV